MSNESWWFHTPRLSRDSARFARPEHHFLIGAQKCGTTSLAAWLAKHPQICFAMNKEDPFWTMDYHRGLDFYRERAFQHYSDEWITMDGKPLNFHVYFVAKRMHESFPHAKLILIVRNPIERAYSAWHSFSVMRPGREIYSFEDAIRENLEHIKYKPFETEYEYMKQADPTGGCYERLYIEGGMYGNHLQRYADLFGMESILVIKFEDLCNPSVVMRKCYKHLELMNVYIRRYDHYRKSEVKSKVQPSSIYNALADIYSRDAKYLSQLTGFDYNKHWGV